MSRPRNLAEQLRQTDDRFGRCQPPPEPDELASRVARTRRFRQQRRAIFRSGLLLAAVAGCWWLVSWRSPRPFPPQNIVAFRDAGRGEPAADRTSDRIPPPAELNAATLADRLSDIRQATDRLDRQRIEIQTRLQQYRRLTELTSRHRESRLAYYRAQLDASSGNDPATETIKLAF